MVIVLVFVAHFLQILVKRDEVCSHATMFLPSTWFNVANVLYVCLFAHTMQMWFIFGCLCVLMCIICQRRALMLLAMHAAVDCRNWVFCRLHLSVIILMRALPQNRRAPCIDLLWRRVCDGASPTSGFITSNTETESQTWSWNVFNMKYCTGWGLWQQLMEEVVRCAGNQ